MRATRFFPVLAVTVGAGVGAHDAFLGRSS